MALYSISEIENILETYSLEDILELNDITEAEALRFLVDEDFLSLPNPEPLDFEK